MRLDKKATPPAPSLTVGSLAPGSIEVKQERSDGKVKVLKAGLQKSSKELQHTLRSLSNMSAGARRTMEGALEKTADSPDVDFLVALTPPATPKPSDVDPTLQNLLAELSGMPDNIKDFRPHKHPLTRALFYCARAGRPSPRDMASMQGSAAKCFKYADSLAADLQELSNEVTKLVARGDHEGLQRVSARIAAYAAAAETKIAGMIKTLDEEARQGGGAGACCQELADCLRALSPPGDSSGKPLPNPLGSTLAALGQMASAALPPTDVPPPLDVPPAPSSPAAPVLPPPAHIEPPADIAPAIHVPPTAQVAPPESPAPLFRELSGMPRKIHEFRNHAHPLTRALFFCAQAQRPDQKVLAASEIENAFDYADKVAVDLEKLSAELTELIKQKDQVGLNRFREKVASYASSATGDFKTMSEALEGRTAQTSGDARKLCADLAHSLSGLKEALATTLAELGQLALLPVPRSEDSPALPPLPELPPVPLVRISGAAEQVGDFLKTLRVFATGSDESGKLVINTCAGHTQPALKPSGIFQRTPSQLPKRVGPHELFEDSFKLAPQVRKRIRDFSGELGSKVLAGDLEGANAVVDEIASYLADTVARIDQMVALLRQPSLWPLLQGDGQKNCKSHADALVALKTVLQARLQSMRTGGIDKVKKLTANQFAQVASEMKPAIDGLPLVCSGATADDKGQFIPRSILFPLSVASNDQNASDDPFASAVTAATELRPPTFAQGQAAPALGLGFALPARVITHMESFSSKLLQAIADADKNFDGARKEAIETTTWLRETLPKELDGAIADMENAATFVEPTDTKLREKTVYWRQAQLLKEIRNNLDSSDLVRQVKVFAEDIATDKVDEATLVGWRNSLRFVRDNGQFFQGDATINPV